MSFANLPTHGNNAIDQVDRDVGASSTGSVSTPQAQASQTTEANDEATQSSAQPENAAQTDPAPSPDALPSQGTFKGGKKGLGDYAATLPDTIAQAPGNMLVDGLAGIGTGAPTNLLPEGTHDSTPDPVLAPGPALAYQVDDSGFADTGFTDAVYRPGTDNPLFLDVSRGGDPYVDYVNFHKRRLIAIEEALGLPLDSIPVAVGEEYRTQPRIFGSRLKDRFLDRNGAGMIDGSVQPQYIPNGYGPPTELPPEYTSMNQFIESEYGRYRPYIESESGVVQHAGFLGQNSPGGKLGALDSPITNDIGYGNINYGRAIYLARLYWSKSLSSDDPLALNPYKGRLDRLYVDMINPRSDATWAVAGLALRDVQDRYLNFPGMNPSLRKAVASFYTNSTPIQKTFLLDFGYRNSPATVQKAFRLDGKGKLLVDVGSMYRKESTDYFQSPQYHSINQSMYRKR